LTYGFAQDFQFAAVAAVTTLIVLVLTKKRQAVPLTGITVLLVLMFVWMSFTSLFAMAPQETVLARWIFVLKIQAMLFVTWMLVIDAKQLRILVWIVTFSVAVFGIKGGIWTVATGGGSRVWGPPGGMLEGNNELAVGLVILMPMLYFLRVTEKRIWLRQVLLFFMACCAFSILGSQSRGALVALLAMAFFLGLKGKYPIRTSLMLGVFVALAIGFMPDTWVQRMDTIRTFQQDDSALSRIWTWTTLWNAAVDNPVLGVGFAADNAAVFAKYAPLDGPYASFKGRVYVAHSIYFQMAGEHGFVGLALFLSLGLVTWFSAGRIAKQTKDDKELGPWMPMLMWMCQVSLIGYAAGGAFLSLAYLDLPYYIVGFVVTSSLIAKRRALELKKVTAAPSPQGAAASASERSPVPGLANAGAGSLASSLPGPRGK
jgi:probable O-glycosylation ligase (exosortase A-associated)